MINPRALTFEAIAGDQTAYDPVALAQRDQGSALVAVNAEEVRGAGANAEILDLVREDVREMVLTADQQSSPERERQNRRIEITRRAAERALSGGKGAYPAIQQAKISVGRSTN